MSYADMVSAHQRLVILQALEEDPDYAHNQSVLAAMLGAVGHGISSDRLRTELTWLAEQGLVTIDDMPMVGMVAKLTPRGADVAKGLARVPGVARPQPGG